MVTNATIGLARVVIVAPSRRFAVALPERVPLATLLPGLVRQAGEHEPRQLDTNTTWALSGWLLRRADGTTMDPTRTLAAQDLRDGEVLHLTSSDTEWPDIEYDDVVEAIAAGSRAHGVTWSPAATRRAGLAGSALTLLLGVLLILQAGAPWTSGAVLSVVVGVLLLIAATVLSRAMSDSVAGAVFAAVAVPYLFVGGLLVLAGPEDNLTGLGAPHLLVGGVGALLAGVIGQVAVRDGGGVLVAAVVCGGFATLGGIVGLTPLDGTQSASVVLALSVLAHPVLPLIAVRVAKVPIPTMPQNVEELTRDAPRPSTRKVFSATRDGNDMLVGLVLGVSLAAAVCLYLTARTGGVAAPLLTGVASLALLLRARAWRTVQLRVPMLVAGIIGTELLVLNVVPQLGGSSALYVAVPTLLLAAAALAIAGLVFSRGTSPSPYLGRIADILDVVLVIAVVPVALGALGLYDSMLGLREVV